SRRPGPARRSRPSSFLRRSVRFARPNELEVSPHVEPVSAGDLVLVDRLLGDRVVLAVDALVAARPEAALGRPLDDLAAAAALAGVLPRDLRVLRADLRVRRAA